MSFDKKKITFYSDRLMTKIYQIINMEDVLKVGKRQLGLDEKNTISIFYYDNKREVREMKLKCFRYKEVREYIEIFNANFQNFDFRRKIEEEEKGSLMIGDYMLKKTHQSFINKPFMFYAKIGVLDFILKSKMMDSFFNNLKYISRYQEENDTQTEKLSSESKSIINLEDLDFGTYCD